MYSWLLNYACKVFFINSLAMLARHSATIPNHQDLGRADDLSLAQTGDSKHPGYCFIRPDFSYYAIF